jgi:hypothetical protein
MSPLAILKAKGVSLRLVDGKLRAYGKVTDELRAVIREYRDELLATLGEEHEIKRTVAAAISTESEPYPGERRREIAGKGTGWTAARRPLASDLKAPQGGAATTPIPGRAADVSATSLDFHGGKSPNDSGQKHRIFPGKYDTFC